MANTQAICDSFRTELMKGSHAFGDQAPNSTRTVTTKDSFKMALYLTTADLDKDTTAYSSTGELAATGNYTAGGSVVTNANDPDNSGGTGIVSFWTPSSSVTWSNLTSSGAFDAALLYNDSTTGKKAVAVFTFGAQSVTSGNFSLSMPVNDLTTGLIRIS